MPKRAEPEPDWELLHLAHGKQICPVQDTWDAVLQVLKAEVPRPAFETWLSEASGVAYVEGKSVVGTPKSFTSEMLEHRLHPVIERAVRDVTGEVLAIEYAAEARDGETCPV